MRAVLYSTVTSAATTIIFILVPDSGNLTSLFRSGQISILNSVSILLLGSQLRPAGN
jgi:hypothetical protein